MLVKRFRIYRMYVQPAVFRELCVRSMDGGDGHATTRTFQYYHVTGNRRAGQVYGQAAADDGGTGRWYGTHGKSL